MKPHVYALILAGGSGTRFWPASRKTRPKQLQALGPGKGTLIEQSLARMLAVAAPQNVFIATGEHLVEATKEILPGLPASAYLAEPQAKNTAPCIAWAALHISQLDEDAIVVVVPSDQYVARPGAFTEAIEHAIDAAAGGKVVTLGIQPTRPETGYGYLHAGDEVLPGVLQVRRFTEKPDTQTAQRYVDGRQHYWNAGIFVFPAKLMLEHFARCLPKTHAALMKLKDVPSEQNQAAVAEFFEAVESISIDFGIMEKISKEGLVYTVPADVGWSDLGSFQTAWELAAKDSNDNAKRGDVLTSDSSRNLVLDLRKGSPGVIALVDVDDLVVVHTDDALVVTRRSKCQNVKEIVNQLKQSGRDELL